MRCFNLRCCVSYLYVLLFLSPFCFYSSLLHFLYPSSWWSNDKCCVCLNNLMIFRQRLEHPQVSSLWTKSEKLKHWAESPIGSELGQLSNSRSGWIEVACRSNWTLPRVEPETVETRAYEPRWLGCRQSSWLESSQVCSIHTHSWDVVLLIIC